MQPGNVARSSFSSLFELIGVHLPAGGDDAKADGSTELVGVNFWAARMGETTLGGLVGRGLPPKQFDWLMPLETVALGDGRTVGPAYVGVTGDGLLHVFFHIKGEGFCYAGMPATTATTAWELTPKGLRGTLDFPPVTGLRQAMGEALRPDWLAGLNAAWLRFWQPVIQRAGGSGEGRGMLGVGRLTELTLVTGGFGLETFAEEVVVFFRPGAMGLEFWPEHGSTSDPLHEWSATPDGLELVHRPEGDFPFVIRLTEHVPAGGESALARWLPALSFGAAVQVKLPPTEALRTHGDFEVLWEGEGRKSREQIFIQGDTLAVRDLTGGGDRVFDRGGFVHGGYALAATAGERSARLTLADPHALDAVPRFATSASRRLEPWGAAGTVGCGVLIASENDETGPLPGTFTLAADRFQVGPLQAQPLRAEDRVEHQELDGGFSSFTLQPAAAAPGQPAPEAVELLLPGTLALRVWEEWDVAHTRVALAKATVGGFYREFNEAKKYNLLAILFSDVVLLNQTLNQGTDMEEMLGKLGEASGGEALNKDAALRKEVVTKILALVQMLPGIKQKLELMASMYPYYWVHQEVEWLKAAFGPETAAGQEAGLRKRCVTLVRREVRTVQGNLARALGEIESAARPIDALLSRKEVRQTWTAQARRYLPLAAQGGSALAMVVLSHGTMGWSGMAAFLASGVAGNLLEGVTRDAEAVDQIGRAAQAIFPWWRVFLHALVTTQWEFSQFVDDENLLGMKRDRALLDKLPPAAREAGITRLVTALRERIIAERRYRFAEVLAGSGVRMGRVVNDIEKAIKTSAREDIAEFVQMFQPAREPVKPDAGSPTPKSPPPPP